MSDRYQDLVIRDGRFIGEFERMYQEFEDPWCQAQPGYVEKSISRQIVVNYIKAFNIQSIVEVGCGLGKTSNFIVSNTNVNLLGIDVSETAIQKARRSYASLNFEVGDVRQIEKFFSFDCLFFSEITWYLLEDRLLDSAFEKMNQDFQGKLFIHNLVFYKGQQRYGLNYFDSLDKFIEFCPFELLGRVEIDIAETDCIETSCIFRV